MKKNPFKDEELIGMKFGLLTIDAVQNGIKNHDHVACFCDCGNATFPRKTDVVRGHTRSCGCIVQKKKKKKKKRMQKEQTEDCGVRWNKQRKKFEAYIYGESLGFFFEESIAEIVLTRAKLSRSAPT